MGTRNLTVVIEGGKVRIAQYGQWDGYPEGQGQTCLEFLRDPDNVERLRRRLKWVREATEKEISELWARVGADGNWATMAQADAFKAKWPALSRDTGSEVLRHVADGEGVTLVALNLAFAGDGCCEWAWVVDLDEMVLECWSEHENVNSFESKRFDELLGEAPAIAPVARFELEALPEFHAFLKACGDDSAEAEPKVEDAAAAGKADALAGGVSVGG